MKARVLNKLTIEIENLPLEALAPSLSSKKDNIIHCLPPFFDLIGLL